MIPRPPRRLHQLSTAIKISIFSQNPSTPLLPPPPSSFSTYRRCRPPPRISPRDWLSPKDAISIIEYLDDPPSVLAFFRHWSTRKDFNPNEAVYTLVVSKFAKGRLFDDIEDLMLSIRAHNRCRLSEAFFYRVIRIYGNVARRISKAVDTLFDMPNYNCPPSVKTFNFVLNLLVSAKQFDVVHEVFRGASKLGIRVDACCLNIIVNGLCRSGHVDAAFKVLDEFPQQRCAPDVRTFSTLMDALCESGELERAAEVFSKMEAEGVHPDTITYTILIKGLRKRMKIEEAMQLLEAMQLKGCRPTEATYQEVLYGLLDTNRFFEAMDLMSRMILDGSRPSFVSYKMLISGLCEKNLTKDVDWFLRQMVKQRFVPKAGMWKQILSCMLSGNEDCGVIAGRAVDDVLLLAMLDSVVP